MRSQSQEAKSDPVLSISPETLPKTEVFKPAAVVADVEASRATYGRRHGVVHNHPILGSLRIFRVLRKERRYKSGVIPLKRLFVCRSLDYRVNVGNCFLYTIKVKRPNSCALLGQGPLLDFPANHTLKCAISLFACSRPYSLCFASSAGARVGGSLDGKKPRRARPATCQSGDPRHPLPTTTELELGP